MSDEIDLASQNEENFRQYSLLRYKKKVLPFIGKCYNCFEVSKGNFCSVDCREDWEKRNYFECQKRV